METQWRGVLLMRERRRGGRGPHSADSSRPCWLALTHPFLLAGAMQKGQPGGACDAAAAARAATHVARRRGSCPSLLAPAASTSSLLIGALQLDVASSLARLGREGTREASLVESSVKKAGTSAASLP